MSSIACIIPGLVSPLGDTEPIAAQIRVNKYYFFLRRKKVSTAGFSLYLVHLMRM